METGFGIEMPGRNISRDLFYFQSGLLNLNLTTAGDYGVVFAEVVEDQAIGAVVPLLPRGQRINGELHALICIVLRLWLPGLVVGDDDTAIGEFVDSINPPHDRYLADPHFERFFRLQHVRGWKSAAQSEKLSELADSLLLIKIMLIFVLKPGLGEIGAKGFDEGVVRNGPLEPDRVVVSAQQAVHGRAVLHGGADVAGNSPVALQLKLERADVVSLNRAGTESGGEIGSRWQVEPLRGPRRYQRGGGLSEHIGLESARLCLAQPWRESGIFQEITQKPRRRGVF